MCRFDQRQRMGEFVLPPGRTKKPPLALGQRRLRPVRNHTLRHHAVPSKTSRIGREPLVRQFAETLGCEELLLDAGPKPRPPAQSPTLCRERNSFPEITKPS